MWFPETMLLALLGGISVGEGLARASGVDDPLGRSTPTAPAISKARPTGDGTEQPQPPHKSAIQKAPGHRTEEVRFRSGGNTLAGLLVLPQKPGPYPAIAFILGSGQADRTHYGVAPHLWRHFASHGFACLSWDKPGVGQSTGDYNAQSFRDRADEALAAVRFLRGRAEVSKDRVGLWGRVPASR
jgi:dipeptidyl aminopeptidase/acylaminoacyl peptidase